MRKREQHMMLTFFDNMHMARIIPVPQVPKMDRELARLLNLQEKRKKHIETPANLMLTKTLTPESNLLLVRQVMEIRRNIILLKDLTAILQIVTSILMEMQIVHVKTETHLVQSILHLDHMPILNTVTVHLHLAKAPIPVSTTQIQEATVVNTVNQGIVVAQVELADLLQEVKFMESARTACPASAA